MEVRLAPVSSTRFGLHCRGPLASLTPNTTPRRDPLFRMCDPSRRILIRKASCCCCWMNGPVWALSACFDYWFQGVQNPRTPSRMPCHQWLPYRSDPGPSQLQRLKRPLGSRPDLGCNASYPSLTCFPPQAALHRYCPSTRPTRHPLLHRRGSPLVRRRSHFC